MLAVVFLLLLLTDINQSQVEVKLGDALQFSNWICRDPEIGQGFYDGYAPCSCSSSCSHLGNCCPDSEYFAEDDQMVDKPIPSCTWLTEKHLLVMTSCPPDWKQNTTRARCEIPDNTYPDPLLDVPVTSRRTNITYLNGHCAICHQDFDPSFDVLWPLKFYWRKISLNGVLQALRYVTVAEPCNGTESSNFSVTPSDRELQDEVELHECGGGIGLPSCDKYTYKIQRTYINITPVASITECFHYDINDTKWYMNLTCAHTYYTYGKQKHVQSMDMETSFEDIPENDSDDYDYTSLLTNNETIYDNDSYTYASNNNTFDEYDNGSDSYTYATNNNTFDEYDYGSDSYTYATNNNTFDEYDYGSDTFDTFELDNSLCLRRRLAIPIGTMELSVEVLQPDVKDIILKTCSRNFVDGCADDWKDDETEYKCKSYSHHYCDQNNVYRNPYCALCNHVEEFKIQACFAFEGPSISLDFSIILKWNGLNSQCKNTEIFDQITNKCRSKQDFLEGMEFSPSTSNDDTELSATRKAYITIVGISVSMACLALHLVIFLLTPKLMNLPAKNLASFCLSLLLLYCSFLASGSLEPPCIVLAVILHYSVLCTFCWMAVISFDVWNTIRLSLKEGRLLPGAQWKRFTMYSAIGLMMPLVIITAALILEFHAGDSDFKPGYGVTNCWIQNRMALLVFVVAPLCVVMTLNIVFFSWGSFLIYTTKSKMAKTSTSRTDFRLFLRLAIIMGLNWVTGIVAGVVNIEAVWYVFVVLNTLQGLFIFIAFSCRRKTWQELVRRWTVSSDAKQFTSTTVTNPSS